MKHVFRPKKQIKQVILHILLVSCTARQNMPINGPANDPQCPCMYLHTVREELSLLHETILTLDIVGKCKANFLVFSHCHFNLRAFIISSKTILYIMRFSHEILLCEKAFRILLRPIREAKRVSHTCKNCFVQSQTTV